MQDKNGDTALHHAIENDAICRLLLQNGALYNIANNDGESTYPNLPPG